MSLTGTTITVGNYSNTPTTPLPEDFYAVLYTAQTLNSAQQQQARSNIDAAKNSDVRTSFQNVSFNASTNTLILTRLNGNQVSVNIASNQGVSSLEITEDNDLQVNYQNGITSILTLNELFGTGVQEVNGLSGNIIEIGVGDIPNLAEELNNRVPVLRSISVDGDVQTLEANTIFTTNAVKHTSQSLTNTQKQTARNNIDAVDKRLGNVPTDLTNAEKNAFKSKLDIDSNSSTPVFSNEFKEHFVTTNNQTVNIVSERITMVNFLSSDPTGTVISYPSIPGAELILRRKTDSNGTINISMSYIRDNVPSDVFAMSKGAEARFILDPETLKWVLVQYHFTVN